MSFEIRKASVADVPAIVDAFFDAFDDHPATRRVTKLGSPHAQSYWYNSATAEIQNPNAHYLLITDTASPTPDRVIGFGKWIQPLTASSAPQPANEPWPEDADAAFADEFFGTMGRKHEEIMEGRPHWYLEILGITTAFQRKGLGDQLLRWGTARADEEGVEAYLSASPAGAPLYLRHGFEVVETQAFDDGKYLESYMHRKARTKKE